MKRNDVAFYLFVGLIILGIASLIWEIQATVITSISLATLLFSIAQSIESAIHFKEENLKNALEVNSKIQLIRCSESEMLSMKSIIQNFNPDNKDKWLRICVAALNCLAFAVFFLGFVIPIKIDSSINAAITIFSVAMIFLSSVCSTNTFFLKNGASIP